LFRWLPESLPYLGSAFVAAFLATFLAASCATFFAASRAAIATPAAINGAGIFSPYFFFVEGFLGLVLVLGLVLQA
jgi:hypothetical protein